MRVYGPGLDRVRKFFEILAHVTQVLQQFVDVLGVHVKRLIEPVGQVRNGCQRLAQLDDRLANVPRDSLRLGNPHGLRFHGACR